LRLESSLRSSPFRCVEWLGGWGLVKVRVVLVVLVLMMVVVVVDVIEAIVVAKIKNK
jgi:hypothetical protein